MNRDAICFVMVTGQGLFFGGLLASVASPAWPAGLGALLALGGMVACHRHDDREFARRFGLPPFDPATLRRRRGGMISQVGGRPGNTVKGSVDPRSS